MKKPLIIIIIIVLVLIAAGLFIKGFGGVGSEGEIENAEPENIPSGASSQTGPAIAPSGKMTDEIYIEILAQTSVAARDLSTFAARMKPIYEKYGVTGDDITAYGKELEKDPQHENLILDRIWRREMELRGMDQ